MNVKELMIGDWVLCKKKPIKVEIINGLDNCINEVYCQGDIVDEIRETDIEHIPLTPEILKANGFKLGKFYYELNNDVCRLEIDMYKYYTELVIFSKDKESVIPDIKFVHELQHALRLCGLNELADNFKLV